MIPFWAGLLGGVLIGLTMAPWLCALILWRRLVKG